MADDPDDLTDDEPDELDVEVLEDETLDDAEVLDEADALVDVDEVFVESEFADDDEAEVVEPPAKRGKTKTAEPEEEEGGEDDDDEPDPDDVEADLDTILKDRLVVAADDEDEDEDEPVEAEEKGEAAKVRPRAPGEFLCRSCFLVNHPSQLADPDALLCRDCV